MVERTEPFKITVVFPPDQPALQIGEIQASSSTNGTINIQDDDGEYLRSLHSFVHAEATNTSNLNEGTVTLTTSKKLMLFLLCCIDHAVCTYICMY